MKNIILCADDYGQNTAISQAIIELFQGNRLSATSCMTHSPEWLTYAAWLDPFKQQMDIGLHFNLTEGSPGAQPLSRLILNSYLRRLNPLDIENELHTQLDQFIAGVGQLPHFLDGHHHIHQLPQVRDVVLKVYAERLQSSGCYLRSVYDPYFWKQQSVKYWIIQLCGAHTFKKLLLQKQIPHNTSFAGVYTFQQANHYADSFPLFLDHVEDQGLIMCHPGLVDPEVQNEITYARTEEFRYFQSDQFINACTAKGIQLSRFSSKSSRD